MKLKNKKYFFFLLGLATVDFFLLQTSFLGVYFFRFKEVIFDTTLNSPSYFSPNFYIQKYYFTIYFRLSLFFAGLLLVIFYNFGLSRLKRGQEQLDEIFNIFKATALGVFILTGITFLIREISYSRFVIFTAGFAAFILISFWRTILWLLIGWLHKKGHGVNHVLIYGAGEAGRMLLREINEHGEFGYKVFGFIDDDPSKKGQVIEGSRVLGGGREISQIVTKEKIDEIIIAFPSADRKKISQLAFQFEDSKINLKIMPDLYDIISSRMFTEKIGNIPLLGLSDDPLKGKALWIKRGLDILISGLTLVILAPFFLVIALAIKLTSTGPVFFLQDRAGKNGRYFEMFKFRSMKTGAEKERETLSDFNEIKDGPIFKIKDDPRVTKVGRFLRRFSLDELPQIINVFLGQMSLVGPRPLPTYEVEKSEFLQKKRFKVTPGMTGLWQIRGRSLLPFDEMVKLDIYYIENWSLWLDTKILLKTAWAVASGRGAY